ncbi:TRAP transporter substrate-binding protein DctP [Acidimangrovimonas pyrenivorans]|uniref:TRAP transporter substrate-binding protein DctP n=1 Tax=Acidimangrovimonas pyrenivorans TaxID=2030798 RepID=A0ABV7AFR4_9RHOB
MKRFLSRACALAIGAALGLAAGTASALELKMLGSFPEGFVFTEQIAKPFMALATKDSGGELTFTYTGPDAVPALEQFEPVQSGVFDLLFAHPAYSAGVSPLGLAIDAIATDPQKRRDGGIIDYIDSYYQKNFGMKLIAAPATGTKGFRFFLKDPITGSPALAGRKIRATVSYFPMIEALGGTGVVMGGGNVYSALQTGVVDGAAWGLTGAKDFKWYEVSKYMADPVFGQVGVMIFMNLDRWNSLTPEEQAALHKAAITLEDESIPRFDSLAATEKADLLKLGMKMTDFPPAEAAQLDKLWSDGVWAVAMKGAPEAVAGLRDLARKAGLSD